MFGLSKLHKAIEKGNLDEAIKLINSGENVNTSARLTKATPLFSAAIRNYTEIVKLLINKGAPVNTRLRDGSTPLHCLSTSNFEDTYETTELLIDNGIDIDAEDKHGQTSLFHACFNKDDSFAQFLILKGANVNRGSKQCLPIHVAAEHSTVALVKKLIQEGANINDQSSTDKDTPLHYAASGGNTEVISFLISEGADTKLINKLGRTPHTNAMLKNHKEAAKLLGKKK